MSDKELNLLHSPSKCFIPPFPLATGSQARFDQNVGPRLCTGEAKRSQVWVYALPHTSVALLPPGNSAPTFHTFGPFDWRLGCLTRLADTFKTLYTFCLPVFHKGCTNTPTNSDNFPLTKTEYYDIGNRWQVNGRSFSLLESEVTDKQGEKLEWIMWYWMRTREINMNLHLH